MDKMTPMDPEYQETPPEWQPGTPGYYGTGRLPKPPRSHTGLIVVLLCVMIVANVITVLMLLTLRMRAVQKNTTVGAETETGVTPTLTAPSGHSVEPTEPRTNGTGTLQISAEDTQTRSAGEIYTAMRPSLALVDADGNGGRLPYHERAHRFRRGEHHGAAQRRHGICGGPVRHGREQ
mgnify:CR=1 FL=1